MTGWAFDGQCMYRMDAAGDHNDLLFISSGMASIFRFLYGSSVFWKGFLMAQLLFFLLPLSAQCSLKLVWCCLIKGFVLFFVYLGHLSCKMGHSVMNTHIQYTHVVQYIYYIANLSSLIFYCVA